MLISCTSSLASSPAAHPPPASRARNHHLLSPPSKLASPAAPGDAADRSQAPTPAASQAPHSRHSTHCRALQSRWRTRLISLGSAAPGAGRPKPSTPPGRGRSHQEAPRASATAHPGSRMLRRGRALVEAGLRACSQEVWLLAWLSVRCGAPHPGSCSSLALRRQLWICSRCSGNTAFWALPATPQHVRRCPKQPQCRCAHLHLLSALAHAPHSAGPLLQAAARCRSLQLEHQWGSWACRRQVHAPAAGRIRALPQPRPAAAHQQQSRTVVTSKLKPRHVGGKRKVWPPGPGGPASALQALSWAPTQMPTSFKERFKVRTRRRAAAACCWQIRHLADVRPAAADGGRQRQALPAGL